MYGGGGGGGKERCLKNGVCVLIGCVGETWCRVLRKVLSSEIAVSGEKYGRSTNETQAYLLEHLEVWTARRGDGMHGSRGGVESDSALPYRFRSAVEAGRGGG